jgi:hypothetical protein
VCVCLLYIRFMLCRRWVQLRSIVICRYGEEPAKSVEYQLVKWYENEEIGDMSCMVWQLHLKGYSRTHIL